MISEIKRRRRKSGGKERKGIEWKGMIEVGDAIT